VGRLDRSEGIELEGQRRMAGAHDAMRHHPFVVAEMA